MRKIANPAAVIFSALVAAAFSAAAGAEPLPLHAAAAKGDAAEVRRLLAAGADPNHGDSFLQTPAHWLARSSAPNADVVAVLSALSENGANLNATDNEGRTPVHLAAEANAATVVAELARLGANIEATMAFIPWTPMHLAAGKNAVDALAELADCGASLKAKGFHDMTPLHLAAGQNAVGALTELAKRGANLNAPSLDGAPLIVALYWEKGEAAVELVRLGASADARDRKEQTALDLALQFKLCAVAKILRKNGGKTAKAPPEKTSVCDGPDDGSGGTG